MMIVLCNKTIPFTKDVIEEMLALFLFQYLQVNTPIRYFQDFNIITVTTGWVFLNGQ